MCCEDIIISFFGQSQYILIEVVSEIAFIICVISFLKLVFSIKHINQYTSKVIINPISTFLDKNSLAIYVCQGLVLRGLYFIMPNVYLYVFLCLFLTILMAILMQKIYFFVGLKIKNY